MVGLSEPSIRNESCTLGRSDKPVLQLTQNLIMPTSDYRHIADVLHVIYQVNPRRMLDIGVGFGKWGLLCREILDVYHERVQKDQWQTIIHGIEINEPYRNPLWKFVYDQILIGDAATIIDTAGTYDLILCCDVIEHFDKIDGQRFLNQLKKHASVVVITSPRGFSPQGAMCDNEFERHRSGWSHDDFEGTPHLYKDIGATFMAVLASDPSHLNGIDMMHPMRTLGVRKGARELLKLAKERLQDRLR
jgi:hypothetical protein